MFTLNQARQIVVTADNIISQGNGLVPNPGGFLTDLVGSFVLPENIKSLDIKNNPNEVAQALIEASQMNTYLGSETSMYQARLDETVLQLKDAISNHISFIRNEVVGRALTLYNAVAEDIENMTPSALAQISIEPLSVPSLFRNRNFNDMLDRLAAKNMMNTLIEGFGFPNVLPGSVLEFATTGDESLDKDLVPYMASMSEGALEEIYSEFFLRVGQKPEIETLKDPSKAIVVLFIALAFQNSGPIEGCRGSVTRFETTIANIIGQAALFLRNKLENYIRQYESGLLVLSNVGGKICVNEDVYMQWIEEGGDADLLLGNALLDKPYNTVQDINRNADMLRKKWKFHSGLMISSESSHRRNAVRNSLIRHFDNLLKEETQGDSPALEFSAAESMRKYFRRKVEFINDKNIEDLGGYCVELIASIRYVGLDADITAGNIHRIALSTQNISGVDSEEAQALSSEEATATGILDYIIQWICLNIKRV